MTKIIIIDDEAIVAMDMEVSLRQAGFDVVGTAGTKAEAMRLVDRGGFDLALLDANLHGESAQPLAERLKAARLPFVWVTGYSPDQLGEQQGGAPVVSKPFVLSQLLAIIAQLAPNGVDAGGA